MTPPPNLAAGNRSGRTRTAEALAPDRLGLAKVVFFTMSATTPLTVVAGVVTTGIALTGLISLPLAFMVVGVVLAVFAAGYTAMGRHVANAGALYAYIARGLSRRVAVGAAWLAVLAYNLLQVGLYGVIGVAAAPVAEQFLHVNGPWWVFALIAWAVTAILGQRKIDVNGTVLAVLLVAEVALIAAYSLAFVAEPSPEGVTTATLEPKNLLGAGLGSVLVLALLGFVGFESPTVYSEETRDRARTVRSATYLGIGVTGGLYTFSSWAISVATGPTELVAASQTQGSELLFTLAGDRLGPAAADIGHVLFVTSVFAALISFHNTSARYAFALGREKVLPPALGRASVRTGAPVVASTLQSLVGLGVIIIYATTGLDPLVQLFYYAGTAGGISVLVLLTLTAVAIFSFFTRTTHDSGVFAAYIAPALAAVLLFGGVTLAVTNLAVLLGVPAGHPLTWIIPLTVIATLALGTIWGTYLRAARPTVYAVIGLGPDSATSRTVLPPLPEWHR